MNVINAKKMIQSVDWIFWGSIVLMAIGYAIPGVGVIGAQILMYR